MTQIRDMAQLPEIERALKRELEGHRFGGTRVASVATVLGDDADAHRAWFVTVVLSDPEGPTWPFEDVLALRRHIRAVLSDSAPGIPYYVKFRPEHEEPLAADEVESAI